MMRHAVVLGCSAVENLRAWGTPRYPAAVRQSPARSATLHSVVIWPFVEAIRRLGLALPDWARQAEAESDATTRVTHDDASQLLAWAVEFTGRNDLGVLAAEAVEPGHFDLIELAARTQNTVSEALAMVASFVSVLHEGLTLQVVRGQDTTRIIVELLEGAQLHPAGYDFIVATLVIAGRRQTRAADMDPIRVALPYPAPEGVHPLARVIQSKLEFGVAALEIEASNATLDLPLTRANASVGQALRDVARELLGPQTKPTGAFAQSVRQHVRDELGSGTLDAERIARKLHVSQRTLRRKLDAEGASLRELIDQERRAVALVKLKDGALSTDMIASQLGFTTAQAFHRAFKRWTGETVQGYRSKARGK
ncbi:MAG: hypothetical protein RL701_6494 [Pseudomonadota bacterium]